MAGQDAEALVASARRDLARRLGVAEEAVTVASVAATQWPDASLGCPEPGRVYAQVLTRGYAMSLVVEGRRYAYHSDGRRVKLCERAG